MSVDGARPGSHVVGLLTRPLRGTLHAVRSRPGARRVQFIPPLGRGGNLMYLWQWAHLARLEGQRAFVLDTPVGHDWLQEFPLLPPLTLPPDDLRFLDARVLACHFCFDLDFDREQNARFCRDLVSSSPSFRSRLRHVADHLGPETVVVNVRRGDYYSDPRFTWAFGIDVVSHVRDALQILDRDGIALDDIVIVSDDVPWCLGNLADVLPARPRIVPGRTGAFDDLAVLSSARTLVLANSTFSYWGSYIAGSRIPGHTAIAPSHHERLDTGGTSSPMFDPHWERTSPHPQPVHP